MITFQDIGVSSKIIQVLEENRILKPSEIQQQVLPILLKKKTDLVAQAQTGTGKTLAFSVPLIQNVNPKVQHIQALVLSPTRELCQQIAKQIFKFTKFSDKVFAEAVYGGEKIDIQIRNLTRPTQIVVATPGRLIDLLERKALDISKIETLVLDEADEMLSMGFKDAIDTILECAGDKCKKWLFSATIPDSVLSITQKYMAPDAPRIKVEKSNVVNTKIEHQFYICDPKQKVPYIAKFIQSQGAARGIVFCKTKNDTEAVARLLKAENIATEALNGDLDQKDRDKVMRAFKNKKLQLIVATDVAARGIDIENLAYVIHHQLPEQLDYYTHRSGRTARAGNRGISIAFISNYELKQIKEIEKELNITFSKV